MKEFDKEEEEKLLHEKAKAILTQPTAKKKRKSASIQKPMAEETSSEKPILEEAPVEQPEDVAITLKKWIVYIFSEVFSDGFSEKERQIYLHAFESSMEVVYHRWRKVCNPGIASWVNEEKWVVASFLETIQHTPYPHFDTLTPEEQLEKIALKYDVLMNVTPAVLQAVENKKITERSKERPLLMGLFACWGAFFQDLHNNKTLQFEFKRQDPIDPDISQLTQVGQCTQDGWRIQGYVKKNLDLAKNLLEFRARVSHASFYIDKLGSEELYNQYLTEKMHSLLQELQSKSLMLLSIGDYCLQRMQEHYQLILRNKSLASSLEGLQVGDR